MFLSYCYICHSIRSWRTLSQSSVLIFKQKRSVATPKRFSRSFIVYWPKCDVPTSVTEWRYSITASSRTELLILDTVAFETGSVSVVLSVLRSCYKHALQFKDKTTTCIQTAEYNVQNFDEDFTTRCVTDRHLRALHCRNWRCTEHSNWVTICTVLE